MSQEIKAIETVYNGYRFRSRLEARWAVFFDTLGVEYEYEPEGFDLGEAGWYLPDFWLPEQNFYIEIKSKVHKLDACERNKIQRLSQLKAVVCIYGDPVDHYVDVWCYDSTDSGGGEYVQDEQTAYFGVCNDMLGVIVCDGRNDRTFLSLDYEEIGVYNSVHLVHDYSRQDQVRRAAHTARQARFEHGETPNI